MMLWLQQVTTWPTRIRQSWRNANVYRYRGGSFSMSLDDALARGKNAIQQAENETVVLHGTTFEDWCVSNATNNTYAVRHLEAMLEREAGDSDALFKDLLYGCLKNIAAANGISIGRMDE